MPKSNESSGNFPESRPPNSEEARWFEYCEKLPFISDENLTRFADKLLTLNTAVLAAYVTALKIREVILSWCLSIPIILFFVSLLGALYSFYPKLIQLRITDLEAFKIKYMNGIRRRQKFIKLALLSYFLGIILAVFFVMRQHQ